MKAKFVLAAVVGSVAVVGLSSAWWRPHVDPFVHLANHRNLSAEHGRLFHAFLAFDEDARGRFFDEVPNALPILRSYARAKGLREINVDDRELMLIALAPQPGQGQMGGLSLTASLDRRDYDLVASSRLWRSDAGTNPADDRLALDFARAKRELLDAPPHAHALLALLHWGVPASEVRRAVGKWPSENGLEDDVAAQMRAFRSRLILEDQSIEDPYREIRRAGLAVPTDLKSEPFALWKPYRHSGSPRTIRADAPLTMRNLRQAVVNVQRNPKDAAAVEVLQRAMRLPSKHQRAVARDALLQIGDAGALGRLREDLSSENGARIFTAMYSAVSPPTAPLLGDLAAHPYLWVRLWAVHNLARMGAAGRRDLLRFRNDPARDVRRIVRGLPPLGVRTGTTAHVLAYQDTKPGPFDPKSPTYWTAYYGDLGEHK